MLPLCSVLDVFEYFVVEDCPVQDGVSTLQVLEFFFRDVKAEVLVGLHVHHVDCVSGDVEDLGVSFVDDRDFYLVVAGHDDVSFLFVKKPFTCEVDFCVSVLSGSAYFYLCYGTGRVVDDDVVSFFEAAYRLEFIV